MTVHPDTRTRVQRALQPPPDLPDQPAGESWWLDTDRATFTTRAAAERARMLASRFGRNLTLYEKTWVD